MQCESCNQRPATVHITQIINNKKREINVCEHCAGKLQQQSWGSSPQFDLHHFLSGLMGSDYSQIVKGKAELSCPKCGISHDSFIKGGLLGCAQCYETFQNQVIPLVKRIHSTAQHTGKVPERTGGRAKTLKQIRTLKTSLQEAVNKEEFERAAKIRDDIRALEEDL